jgi:hypothetical protein
LTPQFLDEEKHKANTRTQGKKEPAPQVWILHNFSRRWMHPNTAVTTLKLTNLCKPCKTMTSIQIPKKLLFEHIAQEVGLYVSTTDVKNMSPNTFTTSITITPTHRTPAPHNKKNNLLSWFYTNCRSSNWIRLQRRDS